VRNRIIVGLLAIPAIIFILFETFSNGILFFSFVLLMAYFCSYEYFNLFTKKVSGRLKVSSIVLTVVVISSCFVITKFNFAAQRLYMYHLPLAVFPLAFLVLFGFQIFRKSFIGAIEEAALAFFPIVYIGIGFGSLLLLKGFHQQGNYFVLYAFIVVWFTDSFAYFTGRFFGRHKLGLPVSPNKTVEGLIGGLGFAMLGAAALKLLFPAVFKGWVLFSWPVLLPATLLFGLLGQVGDLIESVLKRSTGVKDSDASIPGHGGFLDVFDAQIFVTPFIYIILVLLGR